MAADASDTRLTPRLERLATVLTRAGRTLGAAPVEAHQPEVGKPELGQGARTSGHGGTTAPGTKPSASSDPDATTAPTDTRASQAEKGLRPNPEDGNPGRSTDRAS